MGKLKGRPEGKMTLGSKSKENLNFSKKIFNRGPINI